MPRSFRLASLVAFAALCLLLPACASKKLTQENFDKIKTGMSEAEVEAILGRPDDTSGGEGISGVAAGAGLDISGPATSGGGGKTKKWESGKKVIEVFFDKGGKVINKQSQNLK